MKTEDWIQTLAADQASRQQPIRRRLLLALVPSLIVAFLLFLAILGPRPDIEAAAETLRFLLKFALTLSLAGAALWLVIPLAQPGADRGWRAQALLIAPTLLLLAVGTELTVLPGAEWLPRLVGHNWRVCLVAIPLLSLAPLAAMLLALRGGASTSPALTGAVAGLAAGGLGATFYAAHCPDDSPLFVATWYVLAILLVTALGSLAGARWLKW